MRNMTSALAVTTLLAAFSAAPLSPAVAASHYDKQDRYIQDYCHANPHAKDCNDWQSNRGHWNNDRYQSFYRDHRNERVFNSPDVASIFGVTINLGGAPAPVSIAINNDPHHIEACRAHFHTYDPRTDSYMGYDRARHQCMY